MKVAELIRIRLARGRRSVTSADNVKLEEPVSDDVGDPSELTKYLGSIQAEFASSVKPFVSYNHRRMQTPHEILIEAQLTKEIARGIELALQKLARFYLLSQNIIPFVYTSKT